MKFASSLVRGKLIKRYKRFLADVLLDDGTTITCTCPNTGSMRGLTEPGSIVWLSESDDPKRKYRHTWQMIENNICGAPSLVGINTQHPNKLVSEAIEAGKIAPLKGYATAKREQKYGINSRIDILLEDEKKGRAYVEIKNVHLMRDPGYAEFPDSVTERGAKHLRELAEVAKQGDRAVMLFLIQRSDANKIGLAADIDPGYTEAFKSAMAAGVEALAYRCDLTPEEIVIARKIPVKHPR
ncbi:MAG: DNA/RNA nuclease SfsA [Hyphomicrobiaceae bacterium]|nr:DNA/RNA nuclease SfsA [Hyphomicrobiaceae bacterium]MCC0010424.1 DNA/RNA nuclease SfsA [Hyphomicrobiaceae bacterium]